MLTHLFRPRSRRRIQLGPVTMDLISNEAQFAGFRFFVTCADGDTSTEEPDFTLNLCNLRIDGPWPTTTLGALQDRSYRAKKMSNGYYLTDHFGAPAYLISRDREYWIYAEDFEPILWPYAVKHLLTIHSMQHGLLHLKAAGVAVDGHGALLVGRGGSGKTVLLRALCQAGAAFLSNTHALIEGRTLLGIPTAMRVRRDEFFGSLIDASRLPPSVKSGEYTANPLTDFGWTSARSAPVRNILLLDFRQPGSRVIREIERETLFDYMEQFSLAVNVYGLKEDILDHLGGDVAQFSVNASRVREGLHALIAGSRCYYVSCDAADGSNLRRLWELLREPT